MAIFDTLLQFLSSFPLPGLWENYFFLVFLVALRVLLYALMARKEEGHPHLRIGSVFLYLLVLFFFGWAGLLIILVVQQPKLEH